MQTKEAIENFFEMSNKKRIQFLITSKVLNSSCLCLYCVNEMQLKETKKVVDGFEWRCGNFSCHKYQCTRSVRYGSFLEGYKLNSLTIIKVLVYWYAGCQQYQILKLVQISKKCLISIKKKLIVKIIIYFNVNPIKLGGPLSICQIDETKLNHNVKSHRGRSPQNPCWCFCIVDTSVKPALGYCTLVEDRTASTLIPIINQRVLPGTTIWSDEWPAYRALAHNEHYNVGTICHKFNFVCPLTGIHTQNVESYNNKIKMGLKKMRGLTEEQRKDYLLEFMWFERKDNSNFL